MKSLHNKKHLPVLATILSAQLLATAANAGLDVGDAYCQNNNLQVDLEVTINSNLYRVNGTGENLPSSAIAYPGTATFVIDGPGNWSDLLLEYSSNGGASWSTSYRPVTPNAISCGATAVPVNSAPGLVLLACGLLAAGLRSVRRKP